MPVYSSNNEFIARIPTLGTLTDLFTIVSNLNLNFIIHSTLKLPPNFKKIQMSKSKLNTLLTEKSRLNNTPNSSNRNKSVLAYISKNGSVAGIPTSNTLANSQKIAPKLNLDSIIPSTLEIPPKCKKIQINRPRINPLLTQKSRSDDTPNPINRKK